MEVAEDEIDLHCAPIVFAPLVGADGEDGKCIPSIGPAGLVQGGIVMYA